MNDEDVLVRFDETGNLIDSDGDDLIDSYGNNLVFAEGLNILTFGGDVATFEDNTP